MHETEGERDEPTTDTLMKKIEPRVEEKRGNLFGVQKSRRAANWDATRKHHVTEQ